MHIFHWSNHRIEGATHQSLRTLELDLTDNAVRLEIRDPKTRAPVLREINMMSNFGAYSECEHRPSNAILGFSSTGGSCEIARLTIIRLSGTLAHRT